MNRRPASASGTGSGRGARPAFSQPQSSAYFSQQPIPESKLSLGVTTSKLQIRVSKPVVSAVSTKSLIATPNPGTAPTAVSARSTLSESASLSFLGTTGTGTGSVGGSLAPSPQFSTTGSLPFSARSLNSVATPMSPTPLSALSSARPPSAPASPFPQSSIAASRGKASPVPSIQPSTPTTARSIPVTAIGAAVGASPATPNAYGLYHSALLTGDEKHSVGATESLTARERERERSPSPVRAPPQQPLDGPRFDGALGGVPWEEGSEYDDAPPPSAHQPEMGIGLSNAAVSEYVRLQNRRALRSDKILAAMKVSLWQFLVECTNRLQWPIPHAWFKTESKQHAGAVSARGVPLSPSPTPSGGAGNSGPSDPPESLPLYVLWSLLRQHLRLSLTRSEDQIRVMRSATSEDERELKIAQSERDAATAKLRSIQSVTDGYIRRAEAAETRCAAIESERQSLERELESKTAAFETHLMRYESLLSDKTAVIESLEESITARDAESEKRKIANQTFIDRIESELASTAAAINTNAASNIEIVALKQKISQLTAALAVAERQSGDRIRDKAELKTAITQMNAYKRDINRSRMINHEQTIFTQREQLLRNDKRIQQLEWLLSKAQAVVIEQSNELQAAAAVQSELERLRKLNHRTGSGSGGGGGGAGGKATHSSYKSNY